MNEYSGSTDPSLCHGAPVYQQGGADGPVLYQGAYSDGSTQWRVAGSSALEDCGRSVAYLFSAFNHQPIGARPMALAYSTGTNGQGGTGWVDLDASPMCTAGCGITVVAVGV